MLRAGYQTLLAWRGGTIYSGSRPASVTTCSPRMITECFLTRSISIRIYKYTISWYVPVYVHCIYSQSISCRRSLYLFSLSNCMNGFVWHNNSIRKHELWVYHYNNYPVLWALSVLAVLLWLFDAQRTSIVHVFWCRRQIQHFRFRTSFRPEDHSDWEMAPPMGSLSLISDFYLVWMHIWDFFTHMNHVKQLSQCE